MTQERRKRRSELLDLALRYQLEDAARELKLTALCIANQQGLMIAGTSADVDNDLLSAYCPHASEHRYLKKLVKKKLQKDLFIQGFYLEDVLLYLCAVGEPSQLEMKIGYVIEGIKRILYSADKIN